MAHDCMFINNYHHNSNCRYITRYINLIYIGIGILYSIYIFFIYTSLKNSWLLCKARVLVINVAYYSDQILLYAHHRIAVLNVYYGVEVSQESGNITKYMCILYILYITQYIILYAMHYIILNNM